MGEKYWESEPSSVCMTCCGIAHEQIGKYRDRVPKCAICADPHKIEDHRCGVTSCNKGVGKVYVFVIVQCANCGGDHSANSNRCTLGYKAEKEAQRKKMSDKSKTKVLETNEERDQPYNKASLSPDIDLETKEWMGKEKEESFSQDKIPKRRNHTKDF